MISIKLFYIFTSIYTCFAVIANPELFQETQYDGSYIDLYVKGDEHYNWLEDVNGFSVLRLDNQPVLASGGIFTSTKFVYANVSDTGMLEPTDFLVGNTNPYNLNLNTHVSDVNILTKRRRDVKHLIKPRTIGKLNVLIVMIKWADCNYSLPSVDELQSVFNGETQSLKDLYYKMSYGKLVLNNVLTDWITVSVKESEAAQGTCYNCILHKTLVEALNQVDSILDLNYFDNNGDKYIDAIGFIHSGTSAEFNGNRNNHIWSHKWSMPNWFSKTQLQVVDYFITSTFWGTYHKEIARIGTMSHEFGHILGLPDLYDIDGDGRGLGKYSLMANSWGFDSSQNYPGILDAWSKIRMGWGDVIDVSQSGNYSIYAAENDPNIYRISVGFPLYEYLLIENRQPINYDKTLPSGGLLIYHIDDILTDYYSQGYPSQSNWPQNGKHYRIALLQADGLYDLEKNINNGQSSDFYSNGASLGSNTVPNTNTYQNGIVKDTGINIMVPSSPSEIMYFTVNVPQCDDGIKNGDEIMIDCGGLYCKDCTTTVVPIIPPLNIITQTITVTQTTTITPSPTTIIQTTTTTITPSPTTIIQTITTTTTRQLNKLYIKKSTLTEPKIGTSYIGMINLSVTDSRGIVINDIVTTGYFIVNQILYKVKGTNIIKTSQNWKTYTTNLIFCLSTIIKPGYIFEDTVCIKLKK